MITGIKNILSLCLQDLINVIHYAPSKKGNNDIIALSKALQKDGIINIKEFISTELADELRSDIEAIAKKYPQSIELENGVTFNYRGQNQNGADAGMLDIFYIDKLIDKINKIDQEPIINLLKNVTGQEVIPLRCNAYLNYGIENTRDFHIDNTQPVVYKAFIYLTDVPDVSYGPYSFIKKSHRFSFYTYLNLFKNLFSKQNSTDMPHYNSKNIVNAIGNKGDLILSNQNGIHRGLPQQDGKKRIALILSFMIKSRLSYIHRSARVRISNA